MMRRGQDPIAWPTRPLCRSYVLVIFDAATIRLRSADHVSKRSVHWATGCLLDGECEPLGVWLASVFEADNSPQIVADLQRRGVERIWHLAGDVAGPVLPRVTEAFSSLSAFSSDDRACPDPTASARQYLPSSAELAAERVRNELVRALRRHGSFENENAALDFISGVLQRTERRLDRESAIAKGRPRQRSGAQTVPPGF
jgi:transposase-like protein